MRFAIIGCALLAAGAAAAQEGQPATPPPPPEWHPYLFAVDAATLRPGHVAIETGAGYNGIVQPQGVQSADARSLDVWLTGAVGLTERMELAGTLLAAQTPSQTFGFGEGRIELRMRVLDWRSWLPIAITIGGGYQADGNFQSAVEGVVAVTGEYGRFSATVNLRALHYFHDGRDPIDVYVTAAASVRVARWLRLGAEYVGEEIEQNDVDGGGRHYVGPSAAVFLDGGHVRLNATVGAVVAELPLANGTNAGAMARGSVAYVF